MVFRKPESESEIKKPRRVAKTRKPHVGIDVSNMTDAIQDGRWMAPIGAELLVVKKMGNKHVRSFCEVKEVTDDLISTWDITFERWFSFKIEEIVAPAVVVKIFSLPK